MYWDRDDLEPDRPAHFGIPPEAVADERPDTRPDEAKRMGLSRHTEEGALVEFASSLNGAKPVHKLIAWLMLVTFAAPALYTALILLF
jgi:hypothetical protein